MNEKDDYRTLYRYIIEQESENNFIAKSEKQLDLAMKYSK